MSERASWFERWGGALTTVIAVAAIGLAAWEGLENRAHNRLSVAPRVNVDVGIARTATTGSATIDFASSGLGPAIVREFTIALDGRVVYRASEPQSAPWDRVFEAFAGNGLRFQARALAIDMVLRSGEDYRVFLAERDMAEGDMQLLADILDRVSVLLCYCSFYGDQCGLAVTGTSTPQDRACVR